MSTSFWFSYWSIGVLAESALSRWLIDELSLLVGFWFAVSHPKIARVSDKRIGENFTVFPCWSLICKRPSPDKKVGGGLSERLLFV
jgi:hypothetical protein